MPGFHGEYLWELDIAQVQLLALAEAVPEEGYSWRPVDDARSFSAMLVHVAAGNFALLHLVGMRPDSAVDLMARSMEIHSNSFQQSFARTSHWNEL